MARQRHIAMMITAMIFLPGLANAADATATDEQIAASIRKSIPLLEIGAKGSMAQRPQCFTCHNQGVPILTLAAARQRGFAIDEDNFKQQVDFVAKFLEKNQDRFRSGKGTGGEVATAGYALWALEAGGFAPNETTASVAEYLLQFQADKAHWEMTSHRPPTEHSHFTANFLAVRGLKYYATEEQRDRAEQRKSEAREWLRTTTPDDTEDLVFRLFAAKLVDQELVQPSVDQLLKLQREDGGWSQTKDLDSDAYATGTVLVAVHEQGGLATTDSAYRRGLDFLVKNQQEDGSWFVKSRSKPFQTYFESGFPHAADQFISIAASGWATYALALACPKTETE